MSDENNGGYAFPLSTANFVKSNGMTLRDWFAGQAMQQGMSILLSSGHNVNEYQINNTAKVAYSVADAMLAAREGESK